MRHVGEQRSGKGGRGAVEGMPNVVNPDRGSPARAARLLAAAGGLVAAMAASGAIAAVPPPNRIELAQSAATPFRDGPVTSTSLPFGAPPPVPDRADAPRPRPIVGEGTPRELQAAPPAQVVVAAPPALVFVAAPPAPVVVAAPPALVVVAAPPSNTAAAAGGPALDAVAMALPFALPFALPSADAPLLSVAEQAKSATVLLTLRGSNTVGLELAPKLAQAYLSFVGDANVSVVRSKDDPDEAMVVGNRAGVTEAIYISAHGSGFAAKGLAAHSDTTPTDIGMTSRRMTAAERGTLAAKGDVYGQGSEHVLALDGVAVIVNPANPIGALTSQQIAEVFSGAIVDWGDKRLGGTAGPIHLYARDNNSGTFDTFSALVLRGAKLQADAKRFEDSEALSASVGRDPNGIGFIGLPYVANNKALAVSEAGTAPIRPNRLTVATESYALARRLYLYNLPGNTNPNLSRFVEFSLSPTGQAIVEQVGFVSLSLRKEIVKPVVGASPEYLALIRNAERLSTDFRFRFNSVELDNRGARDTTRLADYLAAQHIEPQRLLLVGFGDNIGQPAAIRAVSESRAKAVAEALRRDGVAVGQYAGFGAAMPVADNNSEEGRDKNRRVEVFLRP